MNKTASTQRTNTKYLVEAAMMVAIASVLSIIKIIDMPYGGSVTIASMLPIVIVAYRHGTGKGILAGLAYGVIQQLLGLKNLGYFSAWYSVLAVIMLDYLLAFMVLGLGGVFRGKFNSQRLELTLGALLAGAVRFVCHLVSGFTVWAGWGVPSKASIIYSLSYNSTYMLPEIIVLVLVAWYLGGLIDFTAPQPARLIRNEDSSYAAYALTGTLVLIGGVIADVALIFSKLQNSESGEWLLEGLKKVKWVNVGVISGVCLICGVALLLYARKQSKKSV